MKDNNFTEQKYHIRDNIQKFEEVKNEIISFFHKYDVNQKKNIYISEITRLYHNIFTAWQIFLTAMEKPGNYRSSVKYFLDEVKYAFDLSSDGLKRCDHIDARELELKLREVFYLCYDELSLMLNNLGGREIHDRIVKISDKEYHLPCSVCGTISFVFAVEIPRFEEEENLTYTGITHGGSLGLEEREKIFSLLEDMKFRELNNFFMKFISHEGMDAYCPLCDNIYCRIHYNAWEQYEDGFYDCSYGTCPKGHKRMIDD